MVSFRGALAPVLLLLVLPASALASLGEPDTAALDVAPAQVALPAGDCPRDCQQEFQECRDAGIDVQTCEELFKACYRWCQVYGQSSPQRQCEMRCDLAYDACIVAGGDPLQCGILRTVCYTICLIPLSDETARAQAALADDPFLGLSAGCPLKEALADTGVAQPA